jgi:hypothetical protein
VATSRILSIYDALAALPVAVGSVTPAVKDLHQLPAMRYSADLPVRLLMPLDPTRTTGATDVQYIAICGDITRVTWIVRDLLLWSKLAEGRGLIDFAEDFMSYCSNYVAVMTANRALTAYNAYIDRFSALPGVYEFPFGSSQWFFGVDSRLTIVEIVS